MQSYEDIFRGEITLDRTGGSIPHLLIAMEHVFSQQVRVAVNRGALEDVPAIIHAFDEVWAEVVKART